MTNRLIVGVDTDLSEANRALQETGRQIRALNTNMKDAGLGADDMGKGIGGATGKMDGLGMSFKSLAGLASGFVLAGGLMQLPGILLSAAKAAADDEASVAQLQRAVENSGASWDVYGVRLSEVVDQGIRMGFADDDQRRALALLVAQTGSAEEAQKRFALAMDLSRGANIDLETASKLLGKVTADNVNVLGRYGISVREGATQTELFGTIQAKFGGQAAEFAGTSAGAMAEFDLQMGEAQETLGQLVLPALTTVARFANDDLFPALQALAPVFKVIADAAGFALSPIISAFTVLADSIRFVKSELDKLSDAWDDFTGKPRLALPEGDVFDPLAHNREQFFDSQGIPKLAAGGSIHSDGLAYLHAGEQVVPAAATLGGVSGGSGMVNNFYGPIYGLDDLENKVVGVVQRAKRRGQLATV